MKKGNMMEYCKNKALELQEMEKMEGQPVWLVGVSCINDFQGHWDIVSFEDGRILFPYCGESPDFELYGINWWAYMEKQNSR